MSVHTRLGDTPEELLRRLLRGESGVVRWQSVETANIDAKVGGDLGDYALSDEIARLRGEVPEAVGTRLHRLSARAPWSTVFSMRAGVAAMHDAGAWEALDVRDLAVVVAGHNLNAKYIWKNHLDFLEDPAFIDGLMSLHSLDTDHAGSISEVLGAKGAIFTVGGACASGGHALRCAIDEVLHHGASGAVVVGAVLDFSPVDLQAMATMGAITTRSFNDRPEVASRPFDTRREGFVPSHGGGGMVIERMDRAVARGARILAEIVYVGASADANHLPNPSREGQARLMRRVLKRCGLSPESIDFVSAHATSTPLGDVTEIGSLRDVFGGSGPPINAPKSMLGHTCWAAAIVETIAAISQMNAGVLHGSVNVEDLDPEIDLDVCLDGPRQVNVGHCLKNSFGFGGINAVLVLRHPDEALS